MNLKEKIMKTQNILALFLLVFVLSACEKDEIQLPEASTEANQVITASSQEASPSSRIFTTDPGLTLEQIEFENALQWVAYLTANVLKNYNNGFVLEELNTKSVYSLNDLLDPTGSYQTFNQNFRDAVFYAIHAEPDLEHEPDRPLTGNGGSGITTTSEQTEAFFEYILEDNCIELYFPNGTTNANLAYSSTAHPLNRDPFNDGFRYLAQPMTDIDGNLIYIVDADINEIYVQFHQNVIVARPNRNSGITNVGDPAKNPACDYGEYNMNFDLFLD